MLEIASEIPIDIYLSTYSTLAGTLAGAFGFLVAVVLFVMQSLHVHISNCAATLVRHSPADRNRLQRFQSSGSWDDMIRLHAAAGQFSNTLSNEENLFMDEQFQEMRRTMAQVVRIRHELTHSMYATGIVIMASIVAMPLTAFFMAPRSPQAASLLTLTIIGGMFCIRGYFRLMLAVLPT